MFYYALTGILLSFLVVALWKYCTYKKHFSGLPQCSLLDIILKYFYVLRKHSEHVPFTCVIFQVLILILKKFQNEGICLVWFGHPFLFVYSKEAVRIFNSEQGAVDHSPVIDVFKDMINGEVLITSKGEKWRARRKLLNPAFHVGELKTKLPIINEQAQELVKKLNEINETPINILNYLKSFTMKVLLESILGLKANNKEEEVDIKSFVKYIDESLKLSIIRICIPLLQHKSVLHFLPSGRRFLRMKEKQSHFIEKVITNLKNNIYSNKVNGNVSEDDSGLHRKSIGHILFELHMKDPSFTTEDIKNEILMFIVAGYDTISHALLWCLFMLGNHPEVQERAINEVDSILETPITYGELCNLPYLNCVIKESMRLYTPVPILARFINRDTLCGKYLVPKETTVSLCPYMLHRDPEIYPNPEKFDPERFLDKSSDNSPWTYIPFAEGFRNCIGKKFALIEMTIFLAHILRNFRVTSVEKEEDVNLCFNLILTPSKPISILFSPRN